MVKQETITVIENSWAFVRGPLPVVTISIILSEIFLILSFYYVKLFVLWLITFVHVMYIQSDWPM